MFLCRTERLTAAALDQVFKRPGSFLVKATLRGNLSLTGVTGHTFQRLRFLSASAGGLQPKRTHRKPEPVQNWDTSASLMITEWVLLDRVAAVAVNLSRSVHRVGGEFSNTRLGGYTKGAAVFTGNTGSRSMQTRAASSSSATKRSEEQTDGSKAVINSVCLTQVGPNGFKSPHAAWFLCPSAERIHNFTIKYSESRKAVAPSAPWRQPSCNRAGLLYNFLYGAYIINVPVLQEKHMLGATQVLDQFRQRKPHSDSSDGGLLRVNHYG